MKPTDQAPGLIEGVIAHSHDPIQILKSNGDVVYVNQAWQERFQGSIDDHHSSTGAAIVAPTHKRIFQEALSTLQPEGQTRFDLLVQAADGTTVTMEATLYAFEGFSDSHLVFCGLRNVEDRLQLEETLENALQNAKQLTAFGHTVAHEMKSPLSSIFAYTKLVEFYLDGGDTEKVMQNLERIRTEVNATFEMIDQMLWLAKIEHKSEVLSHVEVEPILQRALERFKPQLKQYNFQVTLPDAYPQVVGNARWLEEVFANVISNAIKYRKLEEANPTLKINIERGAASTQFEFIDHGLGIGESDLQRVFEKFERFTETQAKSSGLGLALVKEMVQAMEGEVGIDSKLGHGTTLWFKLRNSI